MSTFNTIQNIFYSGGYAFTGDQESINEIAFLVNEKYLAVEQIVISTKEKYFSIFRDSSTDITEDRHRAAGGSPEHVALKLLSGIYLKKKRNLDIDYEHPLCGYYPDVMSKDKKVIVECGHTQNADKLLTYFRQGGIEECIQIPYPSDEDKEVKGYSFTAKNGLNEFLIFLEQEKRAKLKTIFLNRKN